MIGNPVQKGYDEVMIYVFVIGPENEGVDAMFETRQEFNHLMDQVQAEFQATDK